MTWTGCSVRPRMLGIRPRRRCRPPRFVVSRRGCAGPVRRTATVLSAATVTAIVIFVTTAGVPNAAPDYVDSPSPTETETTTTTTPPTTSTPPSTPPPTDPPPPPLILDSRLLTADELAAVLLRGRSRSDGPRLRRRSRLDASPACHPAPSRRRTWRSRPRAASSLASRAVGRGVPVGTRSRDTSRRPQGSGLATAPRPSDDDVELFVASTIIGVGDAGFMADLYEPAPVSGDVSLYSTFRAAAHRPGRHMDAVRSGEAGDPRHASTVAELAIAIDHLCGSAGGACIGEPELDPYVPEP